MYLDNCRVCGKRVTDFEEGGYESNSGQRGHFACDAATGSKVEDLRFINLLNETYVAWVEDLGRNGWEGMVDAATGVVLTGEGWEAVSWTGEIRAFVARADAHAWRVSECLEALGVAA